MIVIYGHVGQLALELTEVPRASGNKQAAERIYGSILAGDAPDPQKKAAPLAGHS
jgi:hypothetical protein